MSFGFSRKHLHLHITIVQQSFHTQDKKNIVHMSTICSSEILLQYLTARSMHYLADEHGRASAQSAIRFLMLVL